MDLSSDSTFTGYIGGTVLSALLSHPKTDTFEITALVRSAEKAPLLDSIGIKTIVGSNSDLDTLTSLASEADIVVAAVRREFSNCRIKNITDRLYPG